MGTQTKERRRGYRRYFVSIHPLILFVWETRACWFDSLLKNIYQPEAGKHIHTYIYIYIYIYMAYIATAEACDSNAAIVASGDLRVLQPIFQIYGQCRAFSGPIVTLKVFEDNVLVRELLESKGEGRVLVIDGGGSMRCALVGGNLGQLAQNMGWAGIVVNGCIRDVDEINGCDIGVRALASHPLKSNKKGIGEKHVPIYVAGALIRNGDWLYADTDGILVSKSELCI